MKLRIATWAAAGALIVLLWTGYLMATHANPHGPVLTLLCLTCPIALVRQHPMTIYVVLLTNAATYALAGTLFESVRLYLRNTHRLAH
ncbi:MAG TPA: hypothetical protein VL346_13350 [Acidobacteriaceae bacterium]|jgi:hypothetical protein|nr:hypothetical protein [Acidobacteriaceae bacterium]